MSGATVSGGNTPTNFTSEAGGSALAFAQFFSAGDPFTSVAGAGVSTVTGAVVIGSSVTVSGIAVTDSSSGGNTITAVNPAVIFPSGSDTIDSSAAATVFGSNVGVTTFMLSGADSSVTGGSGGMLGTASGDNSTLVGGANVSIYKVTGANSLAVAGTGITGIDETGSTGPETIATSPTGNAGKLIAFLGQGADTVIGGSGASTILGGSGNDVFAFVKGHAGGSEVIFGATAKDTIVFAGYGYTAANLPTESLTTFDGAASDMITLSDGTKITLVGLDQKLF